MESDLQQQQHHRHRHHQQQNSGLMRYRSAPSSYFTEMLDRELCQQFFNRPSSPETEMIFARFMNSGDDDAVLDPPKPAITNPNPNPSSNNSYSASPAPGFYQSASKPPLPTSSQGMSSGGEAAYSMGMNSRQFPPMRTGGVASSGLVRHSSSPAGLFANIDIDSVIGELPGFGAMRGMGTYGGNNNNNSGAANEEGSFSLKRSSSTGPMSPIAENDVDKTDNNYASNLAMGSWDDSAIIPDSIAGLKRLRDEDVKPFAALNNNNAQNVEAAGNRPPMLAHHLSLPKTQSEMAAIEKFLQFQDSVPCKIRAKRGFATHPRSIAERVRRTRISERMRKLQDLVPNMEKQTNTADMLELAVEYIKDLQNQVQTLDDSRAKCTCSNKQQKQQ